jgi:hypothetical protein
VSSSLETWVNALAARIFLPKFQGHFHTTLLNSGCKSRFTNNFESMSMKICVESWIQELQLGEACTSIAVKVQHVKKQKTFLLVEKEIRNFVFLPFCERRQLRCACTTANCRLEPRRFHPWNLVCKGRAHVESDTLPFLVMKVLVSECKFQETSSWLADFHEAQTLHLKKT